MLATSVTPSCRITCSRLANLMCGRLVAPLVELVQKARASLLDATRGEDCQQDWSACVQPCAAQPALAAAHLRFLPGLLCGPADIFQLVMERICVVDGQPWLCSVCKLRPTPECLCCKCSLLQGLTISNEVSLSRP